MPRPLSLWPILAALCLLLHAVSAHAVLGKPLAACSDDGTLQGEAQQLPGGVQRQRVLTANGVQLSEYANSSGTVFALIWIGSSSPRLIALLGRRAKVLEDRSARHFSGLNFVQYSGLDIELRVLSHANRLRGQAWAPSLLPAGFDLKTMQP